MRILLVDDDSSVLQALIAAVNSTPGHDVRVAAGAQKAHEHTLTLGGVDLLITDVVMEPTDGITLRGELQALFPKMRAAFISGYDLSDYKEQMAGAAMLSKPVNADAVRALVAATEQALSALPQPVAVPRAAFAIPQARPVALPPQPVATPMPTPVPQAVAVPQPRPVAQPVAAPVQAIAVPQAKPVAQPVPVVSAVPQVPTPSPTPVPQAVAAPRSQPVAQPVPVPVQASPQPAPVAAQPIPVVRAVPQVSTPPPLPTPQPIAVQAPVAVPQPRPAIPMPVEQPAAEPEPHAHAQEDEDTAQPEQLVGVQLGDYRVQQFLANGVWGAVYLAIQLSVNRPVGLKVLDPRRSHDENAHAQFLADARAKAAVQHPLIVSVFEADERNGLVFYTHEFLDGPTLADLISRRERFDEKKALQVMKATAEALNYLWSHNFAHSPLDAGAIRFGSDNIPRLANLATSNLESGVSASREIQTLSGVISQLVPSHAQSPGLRALLGRMAGIQNPIISWPVVLQAVKSLEPKIIPVEAAKIKAADVVAIRAVEAARKTQNKAVTMQIVTLSALVLIVAFLVWYFLISNERNLNAQVDIPAGSYAVGKEGQRVNIRAFEIDKYEVTIGQYTEFIEFCQANGGANEHKYDHPNAPKNVSHITEDAKILIGRAKQRSASVFSDANNPGVPVDLNCPMVCVSWWDAYAYANWKGRDLPTQEEWEAAARGTEGYKYPWGNDLFLNKFNSNRGYKAMERAKLTPEDGYNYWAPVDQFMGDASPFKVIGMAGNVAEWTYRYDGKRQFPVVKGGSFASNPIAMNESMEKIPADDCHNVYPASRKPKSILLLGDDEFYVGDMISANTCTLYIGFRTVKRK